MQHDFTLEKYEQLLLAFHSAGYTFLNYEQYLTLKTLPAKFVILRHDVDRDAPTALRMAKTEQRVFAEAGNGSSTYYFRYVKTSNQPHIIREIALKGMEIGYHYEDMDWAKGDTDKAYRHFTEWLDYFRQYYPVRTVCMHGSPRSPWDAKDLWKTHNYRQLGLIGEPYFDTDFKSVFYLTDTGRCWDGNRYSVRDNVPQMQDEWLSKGWTYHSTDDIIKALAENKFPEKALLTAHPNRWHNDLIGWTKEAVLQTMKNQIKKLIVKKNQK